MANLSNQILEKIKQDKIKPKPFYAILLKRSAYWILTAILLISGGLSASVVFFSIANTEWDLWARASSSGWLYLLMVLPYFWLIFFAAFVLLAHYNLRHTRLGYRFSLVKAVSGYFLFTIIGGLMFYNLGFGEKIEEKLIKSTPYYRYLQGGLLVWDKPERGMLSGNIVDISNPSHFILIDQDGLSWQVSVSGTLGTDFQFIGSKIKLIGDMVGTSSFRAVEIRAWCGCGGCQKQIIHSCSNTVQACHLESSCGACGL